MRVSDDQHPPAAGEKAVSGGPRMSFLEHLDELRRRLVRVAIAVLVAMCVGFFFADRILDFLLSPVQEAMGQLAVIRPAEAFMNKMKAALVGGVFLALPVVFHQVWGFISPGLYRRERRWVAPVMTAGTVLFLAGAAFSYRVALPTMVKFLASQGKDYQSMITVDSAFSFSTTLLFATGLVFEMPLVVFALARLGLITARFLWRKFDIAIFVIFVLAAVVTPTPDVATQTIFALPMIGLYLLSIGVAWVARRKPREEDGAAGRKGA